MGKRHDRNVVLWIITPSCVTLGKVWTLWALLAQLSPRAEIRLRVYVLLGIECTVREWG